MVVPVQRKIYAVPFPASRGFPRPKVRSIHDYASYSPTTLAINTSNIEVHETHSRTFRVIEKIASPIMSNFLLFGVYYAIGMILRETVFFYNIKLPPGIEGDDYFKQYLLKYPFLEIFGFYATAVGLHVIASVIYYRWGHPWKVIIWGDRSLSTSNENVTNGEEVITTMATNNE